MSARHLQRGLAAGCVAAGRQRLSEQQMGGNTVDLCRVGGDELPQHRRAFVDLAVDDELGAKGGAGVGEIRHGVAQIRDRLSGSVGTDVLEERLRPQQRRNCILLDAGDELRLRLSRLPPAPDAQE